MNEIKIQLRQIEKSDLTNIKELFESPFKYQVNIPEKTSQTALDDWLTGINLDKNEYWYAITAYKTGSGIYIVGVAGISQIDWANSNGKLFFIMVDKDKYSSSIQNQAATKDAFNQLLSFAFQELNLNKVWIEILDTNNCIDTLHSLGFASEGVLKNHYFKNGAQISAAILSLTAAEYRERL